MLANTAVLLPSTFLGHDKVRPGNLNYLIIPVPHLTLVEGRSPFENTRSPIHTLAENFRTLQTRSFCNKSSPYWHKNLPNWGLGVLFSVRFARLNPANLPAESNSAVRDRPLQLGIETVQIQFWEQPQFFSYQSETHLCANPKNQEIHC